jgi:hypothetical protein
MRGPPVRLPAEVPWFWSTSNPRCPWLESATFRRVSGEDHSPARTRRSREAQTDRPATQAAPRLLTHMQRASLVLRYIEDVSLTGHGGDSGVSGGTVKKQASVALARLWEIAARREELVEEQSLRPSDLVCPLRPARHGRCRRVHGRPHASAHSVGVSLSSQRVRR